MFLLYDNLFTCAILRISYRRELVMAKGSNQKFKLYCLAQIMLENTDDEHFLTMQEIISLLEQQGISAARKVCMKT